MLKRTGKKFLSDMVLTISLILAIITSFISKPSISYINFGVLVTLFNLMAAVTAFGKYRILEALSTTLLNKCHSRKRLTLVLCLLAFFSSMLLTSGATLLALIPLTLTISAKSDFSAAYPVAVMTAAANLGGMATPIGSPQNIFLYQYYAPSFFLTILPLCGAGLILLLILSTLGKNKIIVFSPEKVTVANPKKAAVFGGLFLVSVLAAFSVIHYYAAFALVLAVGAFLEGDIFKKVDYKLLAAFMFLFIAVGNAASAAASIPAIAETVSKFISSGRQTLFPSILLSQIISSVPASLLLSAFTDNAKFLLLGVNIGSFGILTASLAGIISYRLYTKKHPQSKKKYIALFTAVNLPIFLLLTTLSYFTA